MISALDIDLDGTGNLETNDRAMTAGALEPLHRA
jgi:hypothetical protein